MLYFLLDSVAGQLYEEHFLLLVDELVDVLCPLLSWKLHSGLRDMACGTDVSPLSFEAVVFILLACLLGRFDITVLDLFEWHSGRSRFLVPYLQVHRCLLLLLFLLLLSLSGDKYLLFVGWSKRRVVLTTTSQKISSTLLLTAL